MPIAIQPHNCRPGTQYIPRAVTKPTIALQHLAQGLIYQQKVNGRVDLDRFTRRIESHREVYVHALRR